jgi:CHAD domain-containing protein
MSLFADTLDDGETATVKKELRWLAGELARARELDVLVMRALAPVKRRHSRLDGVASLSHDLAERRAEALTRAQDAVHSARFRALTVDIVAWLEAGQWTRPQDDLVRERGDIPIELAAAAELDRRWRKVRKKGRKLAKLDDRSRHKLRIGIKKIRYAAEFFAGLFPDKRASRRREKLLTRLERLQGCLGELNDIAVHEGVMTTIARQSPSGRRDSRKRAFAAGLLSGREDARVDTELAAAIEASAALVKVKAFWR